MLLALLLFRFRLIVSFCDSRYALMTDYDIILAGSKALDDDVVVLLRLGLHLTCYTDYKSTSIMA